MITFSKKSIDQLINDETGGKDYYNKFLAAPSWPTGASGVTVGMGYDLGYNTREQIREDWEGKVNGNILNYMLNVAGIKGANAGGKVTQAVKGFKISWELAYEVFTTDTLPRFAKELVRAYPNTVNLTPDASGALLSLVFNRGTSTEGSKRREMKELKPLIDMITPSSILTEASTVLRYKSIADKVREMKRLWDGKDDKTLLSTLSEKRMTALLTRREREAVLIENSIHKYEASELVTLELL